MSIAQHWSTTPGDNQTADPSINFRENQAPSTYNDSARQMMAQLKRMYLDIAGTLVTTGTGTAYALATNEQLTALVDGMVLAFKPNVNSGAAPTLNVDGLGAAALEAAPGVAVSGLRQDVPYLATYRASGPAWQVHGAGAGEFAAGTRMLFNQANAPLGWVKETNPAHDLSALRVLSSSPFGDTGGSLQFNAAFTARTISQANLPVAQFTGATDAQGLHAHAGSVTDAQGAHTHVASNGGGLLFGTQGPGPSMQTGGAQFVSGSTNAAGIHGHNLAITADGNHAHSVTVNSGGSGTPLDFTVKFCSAIIATKA